MRCCSVGSILSLVEVGESQTPVKSRSTRLLKKMQVSQKKVTLTKELKKEANSSSPG